MNSKMNNLHVIHNFTRRNSYLFLHLWLIASLHEESVSHNREQRRADNPRAILKGHLGAPKRSETSGKVYFEHLLRHLLRTEFRKVSLICLTSPLALFFVTERSSSGFVESSGTMATETHRGWKCCWSLLESILSRAFRRQNSTT